MNMWEGQMANMTWALEHGRILQTPGLFLFGMLVGRRQYFLYSEKNERLWLKALAFPFSASSLSTGSTICCRNL